MLGALFAKAAESFWQFLPPLLRWRCPLHSLVFRQLFVLLSWASGPLYARKAGALPARHAQSP